MSIDIDVDKTTILTFQGDTCEITFNNLSEDTLIGFEVRDTITNEPVFEELRETVDSNGEVVFNITPTLSNKFIVDFKKGYSLYLYGLKQIDTITGEENTILIGDKPKFSDKYYIKVYAKKVEGNIEENE